MKTPIRWTTLTLAAAAISAGLALPADAATVAQKTAPNTAGQTPTDPVAAYAFDDDDRDEDDDENDDEGEEDEDDGEDDEDDGEEDEDDD
ncbi:hypothetical protein [Actinomadura hibisca]|uniref:hypothetical protein n=1 Tax=Actinomadura hibisca TaxID=68565 RepID=UPI00082EFF4B|nr:hypothetical protein [Actinomadura hibisca]